MASCRVDVSDQLICGTCRPSSKKTAKVGMKQSLPDELYSSRQLETSFER